MPNPFFKFKQFTIFHDRCAMKVGTDGILLGAWADVTNCQRILDIGTGTGLVALMLAQRSPLAQIDAVELDTDAYIQAQENVQRSPWQNRIQVYNSAIQNYETARKYDLIVANPPFFNSSYQSTNVSRNLARQNSTFTPLDLIQASDRLLHPKGRLVTIYSVAAAENFLTTVQDSTNFSCYKKLWIKPLPNSPVKRVLLEMGKLETVTKQATLIIEHIKHIYTEDYLELTKDFYLI